MVVDGFLNWCYVSFCNSAIKGCQIQNPPQTVEGEIEGGKGRD